MARSMRFRTAEGGAIDRSKRLRFTFDGKDYEGCEGDTLASALIANGVHLVARSFKYHRPRGILTAGPEEPTALVQLERGARTEPNLRATEIVLYDGLSATGINAWPSAAFDVGAWAGLFSNLFRRRLLLQDLSVAAVVLEGASTSPVIRHMAGLGHAPDDRPIRISTTRSHVHCDVLVVGAGPAGLMPRHGPPPRPGRAWFSPTSRPASAGRCTGSHALIDGARGAATGSASQVGASSRRSPRCGCCRGRHGLRILRPQLRSTALQRRTDHLGAGACPGVARAEAVDHQGGARGALHRCASNGRSCSPTMTGPASCWRRRPRPTCQPLRRAARSSRRALHQQ